MTQSIMRLVQGKMLEELSVDNGYLAITFTDGTRLCLGLEGSPARHSIQAEGNRWPTMGEMLLSLRLHSIVGTGYHQSVRLALQTINCVYHLTLLRSGETGILEPLSLRYKVVLTGSHEVQEGEL